MNDDRASAPTPRRDPTIRFQASVTERMGLPGPLPMIATAALALGLVLFTSGVAFLAQAYPRYALWLAPSDPVALVATAREDLTTWSDRVRAAGRDERADDSMLETIATRAKRALRADALNGSAFDLLASVAAARNDAASAASLATNATRLSLRQSASTLLLAEDALRSGNAPRAVHLLDILMRADIGTVSAIAPVLLEIAELPDGLHALSAALAEPAPWRDLFVAMIPRAMRRLTTPLGLFLDLAATSRPASRAEIAAYLNELVRRRDYTLARYAHLQLLPPEQLAKTGLLANGSFQEPSLGGPFDWLIRPGSSALAEIAVRRDDPADRALLLQFGFGRVSFDVQQHLALAPGHYAFTASLQGELSGRRGLLWRLICATDGRKFGETPAFLGTAASWTPISAGFTVPTDCPTQLLALQIDARSPSEQIATGTVWYDNLTLSRVPAISGEPPSWGRR